MGNPEGLFTAEHRSTGSGWRPRPPCWHGLLGGGVGGDMQEAGVLGRAQQWGDKPIRDLVLGCPPSKALAWLVSLVTGFCCQGPFHLGAAQHPSPSLRLVSGASPATLSLFVGNSGGQVESDSDEFRGGRVLISPQS